MKSVSVISAEDYPKTLLSLINSATKRVVLQSMLIEYGIHTKDVLDAIAKAAERGVNVILLPDSYSFYYHERGARFGLRPIRRLRVHRNVRHLKKLFARIEKAGSKARFVHSLKTQAKYRWFPKAGRNHCKIAIADNRVFSFGGVNFSGVSFHNHDFMLLVESAELADKLESYCQNLYAHGRTTRGDQSFEIKGLGKVMIDEGRPGDSPIFDQTIELANKADKSLTYISQSLPGGKLDVLMHLKQHKWGPENVGVATNRPSKMWPLLRAQQTLETIRSGLRIVYPKHGYIHAKMVIAYHQDGSRLAVTGSHNFNAAGVKLGTAEIALFTKEPYIIDELEQFANDLLG